MPSNDPIMQTVLSRLENHNVRQLEPIYGGQSGGRVFRLLTHDQSRYIIKVLDPRQIPPHLAQDYPHIAEAEWRFYTELAPKLGVPLPAIYAADRLTDGSSFLIMEDLSLDHWIPTEGHRWADEEMRAVLSTYAMLHGRSMKLLAEEPIPPWLHSDDRRRFSSATVMACLRSFYDNAWTKGAVAPIIHSPSLGDLLQQIAVGLDAVPPAVLFNDFYPPNVALPNDGGPAKLFDWQLVGVGPLQIDIVNVGFLSQQDGYRQLDQKSLLDFYLARLAEETGRSQDLALFMRDYRLAVLLAWGVFMPRMVSNMQRANAQGGRFSPWMERTFAHCMSEWVEAVKRD